VSAVPASQAGLRFPLRFTLGLLLMGFTALVAQVVLTRELLTIFFGNELSIALVLAIWLTAVAVGGAAGARLAPRLRRAERAFGSCQISLALLMPLALLTARRLQPGALTAGQVLGPGSMLLISLATLTPVCLAAGLQFVLAARAAGTYGGRAVIHTITPVGIVYALEAVGAVLGGFAFHFYLSQHLLALRTLALLGLLNLVSGTTLLRPRLAIRSAFLCLPALLLAPALLALAARAQQVEIASLHANPRWRGYEILSYRPSKYGPIAFALREGQLSAFQSGLLLFTFEDHYADEVTAHLPLLQHPDPEQVLLIGGALTGIPREVLKHPVERLDCVELDPALIRFARDPAVLRRQASPSGRPALEDPRLHLHLGDGRLFIRGARRRFDVVIVNTPDPTTAALNRFYTRDFFQEARRALRPGGILALGLTGSAVHLSGSLLLAAATTRHTLSQAFSDQLLVPGDRMFFFAADEPGRLSSDWRLLARRLHTRRLHTVFVNDAWLQDALLPFRAEMIQQLIAGEKTPRLNTDLNPVSYHQQTRIWLDQLSPALAGPVRALSQVSLWWALPPLGLAALLVLLTRGRRARLAPAAILIATAAIGGFGLVIEVLALLVFQSACGYLYHALAALIAAFMAGLAIGSAAISMRQADRTAYARLLVAGLITAAAASALLPPHLHTVLRTPTLAPLALGLLLLLVGSLDGAMFPVAVALYRGPRSPAAAAGVVYAADLAGSAGAALIAGVVAVPILGIAGTAFATALLLAAALILALPLLLRA
jgi:spermidine synthase